MFTESKHEAVFDQTNQIVANIPTIISGQYQMQSASHNEEIWRRWEGHRQVVRA